MKIFVSRRKTLRSKSIIFHMYSFQFLQAKLSLALAFKFFPSLRILLSSTLLFSKLRIKLWFGKSFIKIFHMNSGALGQKRIYLWGRNASRKGKEAQGWLQQYNMFCLQLKRLPLPASQHCQPSLRSAAS